MPIIFGKDKTAVLGAIKAQLPFSGGKCQLLFSGMKFRSLQFSIVWIFSYRNRTDQIVLARRHIPLKGHKRIRESRKFHSKSFTYFFSLGAPGFRNNRIHGISTPKRTLIRNSHSFLKTEYSWRRWPENYYAFQPEARQPAWAAALDFPPKISQKKAYSVYSE